MLLYFQFCALFNEFSPLVLVLVPTYIVTSECQNIDELQKACLGCPYTKNDWDRHSALFRHGGGGAGSESPNRC